MMLTKIWIIVCIMFLSPNPYFFFFFQISLCFVKLFYSVIDVLICKGILM